MINNPIINYMELFKLHVFSAFNCNCLLYCKIINERMPKTKQLKTKKYEDSILIFCINV